MKAVLFVLMLLVYLVTTLSACVLLAIDGVWWPLTTALVSAAALSILVRGEKEEIRDDD